MEIGVGLLVEDLCQFLLGDEGFFSAVVASEHVDDAGEAVFGTWIHRYDYNYEEEENGE